MKLVKTYEGYKVLLDGVVGKIESDFTAENLFVLYLYLTWYILQKFTS